MALLAAALLMLAVSPPAYAEPAGGPAIVWGDCPVEIAPKDRPRVRCGTLTVPEDRTGTTGSTRSVILPVVVIRAASSTPRPDPLVFPTNGGPGAGSIGTTDYFLHWADWASIDRDVILVEQRGDKASTPTFNCPELDVATRIRDGKLVPDRGVSLGVQACHDRLVAEGIDLSAYTSAASAADLADLRTALGYDAWNLYGVSYGSRLALTTMRDRSAGLRAVILDGAYPPNTDQYADEPARFARAVDELLTACEADEACQRAYPNLGSDLITLLDRTEHEPIRVIVKDPATGAPLALDLTDEDIARGLYDALYDADTTRALPYVFDQLARGNSDVAVPLAQNNVAVQDWLAEGLRYSVECAEEVPHAGPARFSTDPLGRHLGPATMREVCAAWAVPATGAIEDEPVRSDIPTLILNGARDPVTPPAQGELAAASLSQHYIFTFPTLGHGSAWQSWFDPCPGTIARAFLADPTREPDSSCIPATPPTRFLTNADIHATPAIYRLNSDVIGPRPPATLALLGLTGVVFLGAVVGSVVCLARRRSGVRRPALALTTGVLNLGFVGGLYAVLASADRLILGFGVPPGARWLSLFPCWPSSPLVSCSWK